MEMRLNILFGGPAGSGPNVLAHILGVALVKSGFYAFCSREYQSQIRGGHNFNVLTFSEKPVFSNDSKINIIVSLDKETKKIHKTKLEKEGLILEGNFSNMHFAGKLFKMLNLNFKLLEQALRSMDRFEENMKEAKKGFEEATIWKSLKNQKDNNWNYSNGSEGIAQGAIESGLDVYFSYPMTPATPVLFELAQKQEKWNFLVLELENEIAVIIAAVGSAATGAKAMVGTSGGGFDLMTEAISMAGQAEIPIVIYLSQRPGPGTGVATTTSQGDLNLSRHAGHGEFPRLVIAPGDSKESSELTSQAFYFSQKFKIPAIIMSDKHLAESFYTTKEKPKITKSSKSTKLIRYNSYEQDAQGSATEDLKIIEKNLSKRLNKKVAIEKEAKNFSMYEVYGKKQSKNIIVSWGSTKGAILDSIEGLDVKFLQIKYIEPFSNKIIKELEKRNIILIENNSMGQIGDLIREKTGILIESKNKILKSNGMPFLGDELKKEILKRLK
jgi:2-oxoglutarate ferredoxin oxidoreductase subunit alpha